MSRVLKLLSNWGRDSSEARTWKLRQRLSPNDKGHLFRAVAQRHVYVGKDDTGDDLIKLVGSIYVSDDDAELVLQKLWGAIENGQWAAPP